MVLVVPCTAHMMAKMAYGLADDMASTVLLATDKPIFIAPAMNVKMWEHPATQANLDVLVSVGSRSLSRHTDPWPVASWDGTACRYR